MFKFISRLIAKAKIKKLNSFVSEIEGLSDDVIVVIFTLEMLNNVYVDIGIQVESVGEDLKTNSLIIRIETIISRFKKLC